MIRGKLPTGYYSNPTFYAKKLDDLLGFINFHNYSIRNLVLGLLWTLPKEQVVHSAILSQQLHRQFGFGEQSIRKQSKNCDIQLVGFYDTISMFNKKPQSEDDVKYRFQYLSCTNKLVSIAPMLFKMHFG